MGSTHIRGTFLCNPNSLTVLVPQQSSRRSARNGRPARRRKRTSARLTMIVPGLLSVLLTPRRLLLMLLPPLPDISSSPAALSSYHPSATNLAPRSPDSIRLPPAASSSSRSTATATCSIRATRPRLTVPKTRCIVNVISPPDRRCRAMLTSLLDNNGAAPKYEH